MMMCEAMGYNVSCRSGGLTRFPEEAEQQGGGDSGICE